MTEKTYVDNDPNLKTVGEACMLGCPVVAGVGLPCCGPNCMMWKWMWKGTHDFGPTKVMAVNEAGERLGFCGMSR